MRLPALLTRAVMLSTALAVGFVGFGSPAQARVADRSSCLIVSGTGQAAAARGGSGLDHRPVAAAEQRAIAAKTKQILKQRGLSTTAAVEAAAAGASVPVYVHVMAGKNGAGNVTDTQIAQQIAVLNTTYAGNEAPGVAANTGITFTLAGTDRFFNDTWHKDRKSTTYRAQTRKGGKNALNMWLVDFSYLGVATFPWDYAAKPTIDGIRVHFASLPGGSYTNFNFGETATHEAGHWLGLWHTFQGGCTATNDEVADTPAQGSSTDGCPAGRDSCTLPGLDPIHNYMDYSYDTCYTQFTPGQSARIATMWAAYRA
ncbi:MAG: zinc metalloprotease [Nocardioides sp.]